MAKKEFAGPTRSLFKKTQDIEEEKPTQQQTTQISSEDSEKSEALNEKDVNKVEAERDTPQEKETSKKAPKAITTEKETEGQGGNRNLNEDQISGIKDASMRVLMTKKEKERLWTFCEEPLCPYKSPSDLARAAISALLDKEEKILEEHKKEFEKIRERLS
jgi:hypothetical protein